MLSTFHSTLSNIVARIWPPRQTMLNVEQCKKFEYVEIFNMHSTFTLILLTVEYVECVWPSLQQC